MQEKALSNDVPQIPVPSLPVVYSKFEYPAIRNDVNADFQVKKDLFINLILLVERLTDDLGMLKTDDPNDPEKTNTKRLARIIIDEYQDFSIDDIREAFKLASLMKLEGVKEEDYRFTYSRMNPLFLSKILNSYRKNYLQPKLNEIKANIENENRIKHQKISQFREFYDAANYTLDQYSLFCKSPFRYIPEDFGYIIYKLLNRLGFISVSDEDYKILYEKHKNILLSEAQRKMQTMIDINQRDEEFKSVASLLGKARKSISDSSKLEGNEDVKVNSEVRLEILINKFRELHKNGVTPEMLKNDILLAHNKSNNETL